MLEVVARNLEFQSYEKTQCRVDTFFFKTIGLEYYKRIEKVIKMILCLNHGQAAVERGFSVNKNLLQVNMTEASIVPQRMIYDHMISKDLQPQTLSMTKGLLQSVRTARSRYDENLNEKRKSKILNEQERKRESIQKDIVSVMNVKKIWKKFVQV